MSFGLSPGPSLSWVVQRPYSSLFSVPFDLTFPFVLMSWHILCHLIEIRLPCLPFVVLTTTSPSHTETHQLIKHSLGLEPRS